MTSRQITLYHAARSRSSGAVALLEALGADYRMQVLDLKAGANLAPAYLAINPMGKVPAIVHNGALVTEQVAIYLYLADLYPEAGLAPPIGDALRGPYLRWMVFYGACFEPAMIDKAMHREPPPRLMSPYNDAETVLQVVEAQLAQGPYLLGEGALVRPRANRLGEIDVGVGVGADLASDRWQGPHEVLGVDGPEGLVGGGAELTDDQAATGASDARELAEGVVDIGDVAQAETHRDGIEGVVGEGQAHRVGRGEPEVR